MLIRRTDLLQGLEKSTVLAKEGAEGIEAAGKAVGNESLEGEGLAEQATGKAKTALGDARQSVKDAVQKVADKL